MEYKRALAGRAVKQLLLCLLLLVALATALTVPMDAQTTATVTPIAYGGAVGILQAGDGNFYSLSRFGQTCDTDSNQYCSYIYRMAQDGTVSVFHPFPPVPTSAGNTGVNVEGYLPVALIFATDGNFYGVCQAGGPGGLGTIFKITPDGELSVLKSFGVTANNADPGSLPNSLIQGADGNFYFTNPVGVYQLTLPGSVSTIFSFPSDGSKGTNATSIMQASDSNFYLTLGAAPPVGTTSANSGVIAQITLDGGWSLVHSFARDGSEGNNPNGPLVQGRDGNLYGVAQVIINTVRTGVAYKVSPGGTFSLLHSFTGPIFTNWDSGLFVGSDGNIYGTTLQGGDTSLANCTVLNCGTFYQLKTSGEFTDLHDFEGGVVDPTNPPIPPTVDGAGPTSPVVQTDGGYFYGTQQGGPAAVPIVYKISLTPAIPSPIQLTLDPSPAIPDEPTKLTWKVLNAFSLTAQVCSASIVGNPAGAGTWTGLQTGTLSGGVYSGSTQITPTADGQYTYALTCGGKESGFTTLTVNKDGPLKIVTQNLKQGSVSQPYDDVLTGIGGFTPYTWSIIDGQLPPGLVENQYNDTDYTISGTPLQFGSYPVVFKVVDSSKPEEEDTRSITIIVKRGLTLHQNLQNPVLNAAYSQSLAPDTSGGLPPYKWQLTVGKLPTGLQLNTSTGLISGTATEAGLFSFTITVSDSEETPDKVPVTFNLKVAGPLQVITGSPLIPAAVGVPYTPSLEASGGTPPYSWAFDKNAPGSVPPGLSLTIDGAFVGTPTQYTVPVGGFNTFNVVVSDSSTPPQQAPATFAIAVNRTLKIETDALPTGTVGVIKDVPLVASGGVPPYTWTATTLPNPNIGIQVINGNVLEYNPTVATSSIMTLTVKDSENTPDSVTVSLPLTTVPLQLPTTTVLTSSNATPGKGQALIFSAKVTQSQGTVTPTGQVTFFNGTTILGIAPLAANGIATFQTSFATPGVYNITASYGGSGTYAPSTSSPLSETVVTTGVSATIRPSSLTLQPGGIGLLVVTVTPFGGYTGMVTFSCGTLPAHVSCAFLPQNLRITSGRNSLAALIVTTGRRPRQAPPAGTYTIPITVTVPGGVSQNLSATLIVR